MPKIKYTEELKNELLESFENFDNFNNWNHKEKTEFVKAQIGDNYTNKMYEEIAFGL